MAPWRRYDEAPAPRSRLGQKRNYVVPKGGSDYDDQSSAIGTVNTLDDDPPTPRIKLAPLGSRPEKPEPVATLPKLSVPLPDVGGSPRAAEREEPKPKKKGKKAVPKLALKGPRFNPRGLSSLEKARLELQQELALHEKPPERPIKEERANAGAAVANGVLSNILLSGTQRF